jgi:hypothetical protein
VAGQITDTMRVDPSAGRRVRIERNRAGVAEDVRCEADAPDDQAWAELVSALAADGIRRALAEPDRVPRLRIDAGYFACTHAGTRVAVSDSMDADKTSPQQTAALRRLAAASARVRDEVLRTPACKGLL